METTLPRRLRGAATVVAAVCVAVAPSAAMAQQPAPVPLRPGLIAASARGVGYVMRPEGGVAAVDLGTGTAIWTSGEAAMPVALVGNLLVCQAAPGAAARRLELVVLDTEQQGEVALRNSVELPEGVRVSVGETLEGTFKIRARPTNSSVNVAWRFVSAPRRGIQERPETTRVAPGEPDGLQRTRGAFRMDLATGDVSRLDTTAVRPVRPPRWRLPPGQRIEEAGPVQYESADGRNVLASQRVADDRTWDKYRWVLYDRASGRRLGEVRNHLSFAPFVVHDSLVVYETTPYARRGEEAQPAKLRAVSLRSGEEVWSVAVGETVYRGPFPP